MTHCNSQTAQALIAHDDLVSSGGHGAVNVWGLPDDGVLLRSGNARLCDRLSLGEGEIVYHLQVGTITNRITGEEFYFCLTCGASDFPEA